MATWTPPKEDIAAPPFGGTSYTDEILARYPITDRNGLEKYFDQQQVATRPLQADFRKMYKTAVHYLSGHSMDAERFLDTISKTHHFKETGGLAQLKEIIKALQEDAPQYNEFIICNEINFIAYIDGASIMGGGYSSKMLREAHGKYYYNNPAAMVYWILWRAEVILPIGNPAIGYAFHLDNELMSSTAALLEAMVRSAGTNKVLIPFLAFLETEAAYHTLAHADRDRVLAEQDALNSKIKKKEEEITNLQVDLANREQLTWRV